MKKWLKRINYKAIGFIIISIAFSLYFEYIICLLNKIPGVSLNNTVSTSDRILLITFIGIIWYSVETRGMRSQMIRQNDLLTEQNNRPYIQIGLHGNKLRFKNIGKGDAFKISITLENKIKGKYKFSPYFILGIGKWIELPMDDYKDWDIISVIAKYEHTDKSIKNTYWAQIKLVNNEDGQFHEQPIAIKPA